ncbi:polymeric immunoglobulin receptor isoform X2 [Cynoglossus semilaevis]|uniref:polymeric immunoglobulin receptor isoform X2 n=1 Tax=Cynoglossus semilaevis TaxID=244447 RepID=UPI000495A5F0|nr:polymeric immunoglobulin receptor-like isoform X2 [Cynoglossus semilaevis]
MLQLFIFSLFTWIPAFLCGVTTVKDVAVLEGRSLKIPCHYEPQYAGYVKYWCQGRTREFCTSLARTDETSEAKDKISIFDDPVQLVFTVTLNGLKEADSGWYMCGVEIGGFWNADAVAFTNIKVIHGMSTLNSQLSGEEGSRVTAECLYSERYRDSVKKWCRSGDWSSCLVTDSEGIYEDTSVAISDDRTGAFTVTLKKLQMRDGGWYWCSAGQQKIAVQVSVTPRPTTTVAAASVTPTPGSSVAHLPPPKAISKESWNSYGHILESLTVCSALIALVGLVILGRKMWKIRKQDPMRRRAEMKASYNGYSNDVCDLQDSAVVLLNKDSQDTHTHGVPV